VTSSCGKDEWSFHSSDRCLCCSFRWVYFLSSETNSGENEEVFVSNISLLFQHQLNTSLTIIENSAESISGENEKMISWVVSVQIIPWVFFSSMLLFNDCSSKIDQWIEEGGDAAGFWTAPGKAGPARDDSEVLFPKWRQ
jgi:hypothetical protein